MQHTNQSLLDTLVPEIRRGGIVLAVLAGLRQEEYGYSLKRWLADRGVEIDEGTLYPLLRRLESQGLLASRWALEEQRPRRYYRRNAAGEALLKLDNVVLTPHVSWYSEDSIVDLQRKVTRNVCQVCAGQKPDSVLNPDVLKTVKLV